MKSNFRKGRSAVKYRYPLLLCCAAALAGLTGCSNPYQTADADKDVRFVPHSITAAAADSSHAYSLQEIQALRDYLTTKQTTLDGDNDLNSDGVLNAEDLTLMKQAVLPDEADGVPIVYMTKEITPEGLLNAYHALNWQPEGKVAVKLSTGEPPASNYLRPELIEDVVKEVNGTIVECNTAYGGSRASTEMHYQVAADHGFTKIADFQILDENGSMSLPVEGGTRLKEDFVGAAFSDYDSYLVLSHFKGHAMAGFGGAIKNISIGLGSAEGKVWIHSGGTRKSGSIMGKQDPFCEAMAEAGKAVNDALGDKITYVNVMNRLSIDCDCDGNPAEPDIHDIGILSSSDPVALDQACIDLIWQAEGNASMIKRIESRNGLHTLEHAEEIGLGSRTYRLVMLDE